MSDNDQCDFVAVVDGGHEQCPERAEYHIQTLDEQIQVCGRHRKWAHDRLQTSGQWSRVDLVHPAEWPSGVPGLWTTTQAARHWGVKPGTYRDYVSGGYAPPPVEMRDPVTGAKLHDARAVREGFANRSGRGARTDLVNHDDKVTKG